MQLIIFMNQLGPIPSQSTYKILNLRDRIIFSDGRFNKFDIQLLFTLRTKMLNCNSNFHNQQYSMQNSQRDKHYQNEDHILKLFVLNDEVYQVTFSDVYGSIDEQYKAVQIFMKVLRRRLVIALHHIRWPRCGS